MSRFTARNCNCEDYPCCGCPGIEVSTGQDALDDFEDDHYDDFDDDYENDLDESMDGDFDSAMASAGFGTDEDYGYYETDDMYYEEDY